MYRLCSHHLFRRALHNKNFYSPLLFTATKTKYASEKKVVEADSRGVQNSFDKTTLQTRVRQWDEKLPIPDPPPLRSLVEHLVRRRLTSCATGFQKGLNNLFVRAACGILGLHDAHKRLHKRHSDDPINNCWYAPSNHGDTFGIRLDEIYFHEDIIPSQPVTSYAVLIRGSPKHPGTSVYGGIGEEISSNAVSMQDCGDFMIERASSLIDGLMKARDLYRSAEFTQDVMKTTALSMQWYNYVFSCSMQFFPGSIERYKAPEIHSRHIIVMIRGNMYKLDLIRNDDEGREEIITKSQLKEKFETIVEMDASRELSTPTAFLTSLTPSERCQEEQRLKCLSQRNVDNLSLLRDALFVVALDPNTSPRKANEAMFELHSGNFVNRWYDKSVQLVVFGNGVAGFVNNYLAGMTGTVGTNFVRIAVKNERLAEEETEDGGSEGFKIWPEASPIIWDDTNEEYFKHKTAKFIKESRTSGPFKQISQDVFRICAGFSFESMCKSPCVTPGGAFQAGMQLALAKISGRCMSVNEVVSIRHFRFGGMTFMDSSMADMKKFIDKARQSGGSVQTLTKQERALLKSLLKKAIESYKDEVLRYKKGQMNLWHLDALYRNIGLPNRLPFRKTPELQIKRRFRQAVANLLRSPLLNILPPQVAENVTSNPCWYPEIEAIGRPGVKCILPDTSMALHYMFGRNAISITVNANPKHPCYRYEEEFIKELEQSLWFVNDLLDAE